MKKLFILLFLVMGLSLFADMPEYEANEIKKSAKGEDAKKGLEKLKKFFIVNFSKYSIYEIEKFANDEDVRRGMIEFSKEGYEEDKELFSSDKNLMSKNDQESSNCSWVEALNNNEQLFFDALGFKKIEKLMDITNRFCKNEKNCGMKICRNCGEFDSIRAIGLPILAKYYKKLKKEQSRA